jgi:DUF4097 and DUF4098 domain-containing protein YvlB
MNIRHKGMAIALAIVMLCAAANAAMTQVKKEQSFPAGKSSSLDVSVNGGDIVIKTWEKSEVNVVVDGIDEEDMEFVKISQSGDEVRVSYKPKWGSHSSGTFTITVPTYCKVEMRTAGGNPDLRGNLLADAKGSTSGGDITIERVKGNVTMSTSGGDIKTGDIEGKAELRTSGGNIRLATVNGEASVSTSGGDIRIEKVGKKLDARTSGGDIEVGDIGGDANLSTAGGDLQIGKVSGSATVRTSGGNIDLRGATGSVIAKTSGGDIDMKNIVGTVEASTAGGDISADMQPSGKGGSSLRSAGGDIHLSIPSAAKVTIEATIRLQSGWGSVKKYDIRSDFKAESYEKDDDDEIRAKYLVNGGGETITLQTVNGNIDIKKK